MNYYFKVKKISIALVDRKTDKYLALSFFSGSDGSGYLTINSSNPRNPDYTKFSFHRRTKEFRYSFTNEIWKELKKPNKERTKFFKKIKKEDEFLADIRIDRSALFRIGKISSDFKKAFFPKSGFLELKLSLKNWQLVLDIKKVVDDNFLILAEKISKEVLKKLPTIMNDGSGCAQISLSDDIPLRFLVYGI